MFQVVHLIILLLVLKQEKFIAASTGNANTIMGSVAGQNMTDGEKNVIIGYSAANGSGSNLLADGDFNVFIGAIVKIIHFKRPHETL